MQHQFFCSPLRRLLRPAGLVLALTLGHMQAPAATAATTRVDAASPAAPADPTQPVPGSNAPGGITGAFIAKAENSAPDKALDAMEAEIRAIYATGLQDHDMGHTSADLASLLQRATAVATQADTLMTRLKPYHAMYQNFLDILGKPPASGDPAEAASITEQRNTLTRRQKEVDTRMVRLRLYQAEAQQLISALRQHGDAIQQATLWQRFPSPLGINFWSGLASAFRQDSNHLHELAQQTVALTDVAFTGSRIFITLGGIAGTLLLMAIWLGCHTPVRRLVSRFVPFGRLRPITATLACATIATAAWGFSFQILWNILSFDNPAAQGDLSVLADMVATQAPLCGFVLELGWCLFSRAKEWRVFTMPDELARNLRLFPAWLAVAMLVRGALRYMDTHSGLSLLSVQLMDGAYTLAVSPLLFAIPRELRVAATTEDEDNPPLAQFLRSLAMTVAIVCWLAVFSGYIPLAYTIISWLSMMSITLAGLLLVSLLSSTLCATTLPAHGSLGQRLTALGIPARLVNQISVLIPGAVNLLLLVVAFAVASSGGGFDPSQVWTQLGLLFNGQTNTETHFVSLNAVLLCVGLLIAGHYVINLVKSWLSQKFFPTTRLDTGAQASILGILGYSAWILIGLAMLSVLGVTVKSLTWVVSALSVGIGFGLQSIVQNFVSGIILMAERPVSVGDTVTIAGVTGKVGRISVRSTDILLDDKSTMIVPNSQFITSAVKNATAAQKPGVFTVTLDVPFSSDLDRAMQVMADTLSACDAVDSMAPVTVDMTSVEDGMVLLTGTATARADLTVKLAKPVALRALWQAFHEQGIAVASRQVLLVHEAETPTN